MPGDMLAYVCTDVLSRVSQLPHVGWRAQVLLHRLRANKEPL